MVSVRLHALPALPVPMAWHRWGRLNDGRIALVGGWIEHPGKRDVSCDERCISAADVVVVDPERGSAMIGPRLLEARQPDLVHCVDRGRLLVVGGGADYG